MRIIWPVVLIGATLWIGAVIYGALTSWPHLPLDLPARDPQVQAALAGAVRTHVAFHVALALGPLLLACGSTWLVRQRRRHAAL